MGVVLKHIQKKVLMVTVEVIIGPMFSGKTEELIKRLRKVTYAKKKVIAVKPKIDTRAENIVTRFKRAAHHPFEPKEEFPARKISSKEELLAIVYNERPDVLAIDEAQFLGEWFFNEFLVPLKKKEDELGFDMRLIISGLDTDAWRNPFGIMPLLIAAADNGLTKEMAVCFRCGKSATLTQKKSKGSGQQIEVGDSELYEARCLACWTPPEEQVDSD